MPEAYVALGANLGDPALTLRHALISLIGLRQTQLLRASSLYQTAPVDSILADGAPVHDYVNAVVQLQTDLSAPALLDGLQRIEAAFGRERPYRNAPRTLDLDLLLYGSASINSQRLTVPHPRMWLRAFVLVPLAEIAPELVSAAQLASVADQAIHRLAPF